MSYSDDIESLRRRVEARRRKKQKAELRRELNGWNHDVDDSVIYMTTTEVMSALGVHKTTVLSLIHSGELEAIRSTAGSKTGTGWCIHPKSVERLKAIYVLQTSG